MQKKNKEKSQLSETLYLSEILEAILLQRRLVFVTALLSLLLAIVVFVLTPKQYQTKFSITFQGGTEYYVDVRNRVVESKLIKENDAEDLVSAWFDSYSNYRVTKIEYYFGNNNAYPITFVVNTTTPDLSISTADDVLDYLNGNDFVVETLNVEKKTISEAIDSIASDLDNNSHTYDERAFLEDRIIELSSRDDSLAGFVYVTEPYLINGGNPIGASIYSLMLIYTLIGTSISIMYIIGKLWVET